MSSMNWVFLFLPSAWIISLSLQRAFFIVDRKCSPSILKDTSCQSHDLRSKGVLFSSLQYKNDQGRILVSKPDHVHASCTHHCGQRSEVLWLTHWHSSVASGQSDTKKQKELGSVQFSSVQSLSRVRLFETPWIAACQASLSITISRSSLKLMSIESVMPSSHLIFCCPLFLLPPIPPSIRVFSNESALPMRWPKYWSFSFSIIPSKVFPGLMSFRMDWLDLLVGLFSTV